MARVHLDPVAHKKKVRRIRIVVISLTLILIIAAAVTWLLREKILPARRYSRAEALLEQGRTQEAIDAFSLMAGYKDAFDRAASLAWDSVEEPELKQTLLHAELGDTVYFGSYEQDGDPENGPEPIAWIVLGDDRGRLLLWSSYALAQQPYHSANEGITWADSSLRQWLNGSFYETAFTASEQRLIAMTGVENPDNAASGTKGGGDTEDRVCILSFNELLAFGYYNDKLEAIYAYPTPAAKAQGVEPHDRYGTCSWWLRTPGIRQNCAAYCDMVGTPLYSGVVNSETKGVRPTVWVFVPGRGE